MGSGNILMPPNDQYLCIVPGSHGKEVAGTTFLPFEGDRTLSIILSKALMLAQDDTITEDVAEHNQRAFAGHWAKLSADAR